jgi:hypothetical protein
MDETNTRHIVKYNIDLGGIIFMILILSLVFLAFSGQEKEASVKKNWSCQETVYSECVYHRGFNENCEQTTINICSTQKTVG